MWLSAPVLVYVPVDIDNDCVRYPNCLMHAWVHGTALVDGYVGNAILVALEPVWLLLSSSDGLRSEESDHINVLASQAMSKPR